MALPGTTTTQLSREEDERSSLLVELDKGLRSSNVGSQCEAILIFKKIANIQPAASPTLLNAALLKLADMFRTSNNFIRFAIFKVIRDVFGDTNTQQYLLHKLVNIDETLRRINSVLQSNDPVARAITLRTLGSMSVIVADKLNIHHGIRNCIESNHQLEVEAAIYAIDCLCSKSSLFAQGIVHKIAALVEGIETALSTKLKLIRIFRHMHYTPQIAEQARSICLGLLDMYPGVSFYLTILDTLTKLAEKTLYQLPKQLEFLERATADPRSTVTLLALDNLVRLARIAPHLQFDLKKLFQLLNIESSLSAGSTTVQRSHEMEVGIVRILEILSKSEQQCQKLAAEPTWIVAIEEMVLFSCQDNAHSPATLHLTRLSISLLLNIIKNCEPAASQKQFDRTLYTLSTSLLQLLSSKQQTGMTSIVMQGLSRLSAARTDSVKKIVPTLLSALEYAIPRNQAETSLEIARCLSFCLECDRSPQITQLVTPLLLQFIPQISKQENNLKLMPVLCRSLFLTQQEQKSKSNKVADGITTYVSPHSEGWLSYCIGKEALQYGMHHIGLEYFSQLKGRTSSPSFFHWLSALENLAEGETFIQSSGTKLADAISRHSVALSELKASQNNRVQFTRSIQFVSLRIEFFERMLSLLSALLQSQDQFNQSLLAPHSSQWRELANKYQSLRNCFLPHSKNYIWVYQYQLSCLLISTILETLLLQTSQSFSDLLPLQSTYRPEESSKRFWNSPLYLLSCKTFQDLDDIVQHSPSVYHNTQRTLLLCSNLSKLPGLYPPFFFKPS